MAGIGMNFAADGNFAADIEPTLVHASALGMDDSELRVLSLLTTWMDVHHAHVNMDRLVRLVKVHPSLRVRAYWSAIATWLSADRRFARLARVHRGGAVDLLSVGTDFQLARRGADERFAGSKVRVPRGALRDRIDDVLSPAALARRHPGYRNRVIIGPTWRADVWTILEKSPTLRIAEIARRASCSFATAWQVAQDFRLLAQAGEPRDRIVTEP
jgi:hypothetical protein